MSLRPIDRFVSALHRDNGDELLLETGKPGRIRHGSQERVLLAQEVRTDQIEVLLRDVVPEDCQRNFQLDGEVAFPYRATTGPVLVRARRAGDRLAVSVRPYPQTRSTVQAKPVAQPVITGNSYPGYEPAPVAKPARPAPVRDQDAEPISLDLSTGEIPMLSPLELTEVQEDDSAKVVLSRANAQPPAPARFPPAMTSPVGEKKSGRKAKNRIDPILFTLIDNKASDLHLTAGLAPRFRKDGDIEEVPGFGEVLESHTIEAWLMEIAPPKSRDKFNQTSDADFAYELPGLARLRVNMFRDRRGVGGVLRVIPAQILTADQLRLPPVVRELCTLDKGLVVVTGPTGSGKSTTLAAMIDLINKTRPDHVITIEDPVEFVHQPQKCLINQREVHSDTESFSSGLRAALREDPDIVLVGEMRDLETVAIAMETAETGHCVFGTLHTNTAVSTVDRIIDQFPADRQAQVRTMLAGALKGVIAQTLCKKIGGGRVAALEILLVLPAVANLIREGKTFQIPSIMQTGKAAGMQTLNDALFTLVNDKQIEAEEAMRAAIAKSDLKVMLERANLIAK